MNAVWENNENALFFSQSSATWDGYKPPPPLIPIETVPDNFVLQNESVVGSGPTYNNVPESVDNGSFEKYYGWGGGERPDERWFELTRWLVRNYQRIRSKVKVEEMLKLLKVIPVSVKYRKHPYGDVSLYDVEMYLNRKLIDLSRN